MGRMFGVSFPEAQETADTMGHLATPRRRLIFTVPQKKYFEIGVGDANCAAEPMHNELATRDPAARGPLGHANHLGDLSDGVEFQETASPTAIGRLKIVLATEPRR